MPESPTTEGSIVAYLRLDSSDWNEKLDAAEAKARELGRIDPTVRVSADTAEALAKLEEVRALEDRAGGTVTTTTVSKSVSSSSGSSVASDAAAKVDAVAAAEARLAAAEQASEMATQRAIVAEMRLNEQRDKGRLSDAQLAAAELTVAAAIQRSEAAAAKAAAAEDALAAAQRKAAEAAVQGAAAQEAVAAANDTAGKSAAGNASYMGLVVAGIGALVPLTGALAGATVGLGGAFVGMGAAGYLAYRGIQQQMDHNTASGLVYRDGVNQLRDSLDILSATAAVRMLSSFQQAVATINDAMPELNTQVSVFTGYAGRIGNDALSGAVTALQVLNPLFVQAGDYVEHLAQGFLQWTQNGGLAAFTAYATKEFPPVVATIGSLIDAVTHVAIAMAPWGGTMLTAIKAFADAINAIPTGILPEVAIGATAAYLALSKLSTVKAGLAGVGDSLTGMQANAKGAFGAILEVTAAVDAMVLKMTAAASDGIKQFQGLTQSQDKWAASVRAGHIDTQALGTTLQRVGGFWNDFGNNMDIAGTAFRPFYDNVKALDQAMASATPSDLKRAYTELVSEGAKVGKSQQDIAALFPEATAALHAQEQGADAAAAAQGRNAAQVNKLTDAQNKAVTATDKFAQALQGLGSTNLSATAAAIAYTQAVADSDAALQKNGATLDINTQKGRDNMTALDSIASSAIATVAAQAKAGASTQDLTNDMVSARAQFISTAEKMGDTAAQANALADQYGLIPSSVTTAVKTSGLGDAQKEVANLQGQLAQIARDWTAKVNIVTSGSVPTAGHLAGFSTGGLVAQYRASGGAIDTAYLASGGNPIFQPRGTDTIPAMLTPGEFVVKQSSASQHPGFLNAYNANPAAAIDSVRRSGAKPATYNFYIYQADNPTAVAQRTAHYLASQTV